MSDSYETPEALISSTNGIDCRNSDLNETRITLRDSSVVTCYGVRRIEQDECDWTIEVNIDLACTQIIPLGDIVGFEMVER